MAIIVGVGSSQNQDSAAAIQEAYHQAQQSLQDQYPSLAVLLASPTQYNQQELLNLLKQTCPDAQIIGCSTSGEITNAGSFDHSLALMLIHSDSMKFVSGVGDNIKKNPKESGKQIAQDLLQKNNHQPPQAALIFPDGLAGNGADIVRGILDEYGNDFMLAGGSAGDDFEFKKTYQYIDNQLLTGSVVGVGLDGDFHYGIGVKHGWIPIGTGRKVTKSESNVIHELDRRPAIEIYQDHFGKDRTMVSQDEPLARMAITYPLGIIIPGKDEYLIRDPITVDQNGAITCAAEVPEGSEVYLMIGSPDEAIEAAAQAAHKAVHQVEGKQIKAAFLFNCIARKKLLMNKKQDEIDKIRQIIGQEVPLIGFYTYGEQAPLGGEVVTCSFHNETDVLFLLAE